MILQAKNIHKSYFQGTTQIDVLKGLNLDIKAGETVAILGRSGAGKSTFLKQLNV